MVALPRSPRAAGSKPLTLEAIARYPLITYDDAFSGRSLINKAFLGRGLKPNVVLTAIDSDVIKTYVAMDLGVGILASMAYDPAGSKPRHGGRCASVRVQQHPPRPAPQCLFARLHLQPLSSCSRPI
jgi:DNA-binding transcriptional LysR family regulator